MTTNPETIWSVTAKRQIAIPADLLGDPGLKVGDYLGIEADGLRIILIAAAKSLANDQTA